MLKPSELLEYMAGAAGFEPTNTGVKVPRLTAWPRPYMAPQVGLEPTTLRLTAACSTIELLRNIMVSQVGLEPTAYCLKGSYSSG